jgi:hypothetical protein
VTDSRPDDGSRPPALAVVIPLSRSGSGDRADRGQREGAIPPVVDVATARTAMARDVELLRRRFGDRWPELPHGIGRRAAAAETLLESGPTAIDPHDASPIDAASGGWLVVRAALALAEQVVDDAELLGEALGVDLLALPLGDLDKVVVAVLDLGLGFRVEPTWANPAAADAARIVLDAHGAQLRSTNDLHDELYARFTDHVLDIPEDLLQTGSRAWRLVSRAKLRGALAASSRTGRVPGGRRAAAQEVLEVREARKVLTTMTPLLTRHLGRTAFGPLTDVDSLSESLSAVRRLQRALGDSLDPARLSGLLVAEAFRSPELAAPAAGLRATLQTWRTEAASLCDGDPWVMPAEELASWAVHTAAVLPSITTGAHAVIEIGQRPTTVRVLVDDLLLRENVADLAARLAEWGADQHTTQAKDSGSAS